ncbi:alpha/beta fold hydrolase [Rhodococcus hoagii]|nr:alpha/beta fold hydrolase [Prescottella equi]
MRSLLEPPEGHPDEDGRTALHYELHGDPDAPPVLLLGSLGSDLHMWDPQIHALSAHHRVIAVDHRGHGGSPPRPGRTRSRTSAATSSRSRHTRDRRAVHFVGLSLGGAVGQWLAAHRPQHLRTLTVRVHGSAVRARAAVAGPGGGRPRRRRRLHRGRRGRTLVTPELAQRDPELVARHVAMVRGTTDEGLRGLLRGARALGRPARPGRIVAPTR